jgi:Arc/MetJ family transcription regulator
MRTNIDIDDKLMKQAMKATGTTTKKAAVEASLRLTVQLKEQAKIRDLFGKVEWEGDLDAMREGRFVNWDEDIEKEKLKDPAA